MKNISLLFGLFFCFFITNVYALSKNSHEKVTFCINMSGFNGCETMEEKQVYKLIYDQKYDSMFSGSLEHFDKAGFDSHYFVDDMKNYTNCYAEAFAKEITMQDVNMIYNETTPQVTREAIINNIADKHVDKCRKKYAPYMDKMENIVEAYITKACGSTKPSDSIAKKCKKEYTNPDEALLCQIKNDNWYKCVEEIAKGWSKDAEEATQK